MKKLMIAAAIVCAAAMSQAAMISWGTAEDLVDKATGTSLETTSYTFVLAYIGDGTDYTVAYENIRNNGAFSWNGEYNEITGAYTLDATKDHDGYIYAVLAKDASGNLYQLNEYDGDALLQAYTLSGFGDDPTSTKVPAFTVGTEGGSGFYVGAKIENVPEPTSGLLLLLGVAGLALRRRRA